MDTPEKLTTADVVAVEPGYLLDGTPAVKGVVSGTLSASGSGVLGTKSDASRRVETAMSQAITECMAEGILDPVVTKARMMAARQDVLDAMRVEKARYNATVQAEALGVTDPADLVARQDEAERLARAAIASDADARIRS